jgi:probable phosphoglycerate mutase
MTTIYLLRHGEIESDGILRFLGQTDVRLSPRGFEQARMWRDAFAETHFDAIYASNLSRCAETARIIAANTENDVCLLPELREIHLGKLEGLAMNDVRERFRDEWEARGKDIVGYVPEGGESFSTLQQRVLPVFLNVFTRHPGNILMVTHAGVNRVILCHILGMPLSNLFRIEQSYGCLNLLESSGVSFRLIGINLGMLP